MTELRENCYSADWTKTKGKFCGECLVQFVLPVGKGRISLCVLFKLMTPSYGGTFGNCSKNADLHCRATFLLWEQKSRRRAFLRRLMYPVKITGTASWPRKLQQDPRRW